MNSTGIHIDCRHPDAVVAARIAAERLTEIDPTLTMDIEFVGDDADGYSVTVDSSRVLISAGQRRDFLAAVGFLLEMVVSDRIESVRVVPALSDRIHYLPGHFGNSFEVAWPAEMRRYLEDLALAGASGYGDWFDPNDMPDPYRPHVYHSTSMSLWRRKKEWLAYAAELGLDRILVITPNVGFVDQMRPEWTGVRNPGLHVQGQVLCPSIPAARDVIRQNQRTLFEDLAASGVTIDRLVLAPYDDGGCACDRCQPYYPIFLELVTEVYELAHAVFPTIAVDICGWWTSEIERSQLLDFAAGPAQEWLHAFQFSASYGVRAVPDDIDDQLPGIRIGCFLHIGFSDDRRDVYTSTGFHSAPARISSVIASLAGPNRVGYMTYNEAVTDHYNAFLASRLGSIPDTDPRAVTEFYCRLVLGLSGPAVKQVVDIIHEMQYLDSSQAATWARTLTDIAPRVHENQAWAFEHIRLKAEMMALDFEAERLIAAGALIPAQLATRRVTLAETLWRQLYGFGVLRHIFIPERMLPDWCQSDNNHNGRIRSGMMNSHA